MAEVIPYRFRLRGGTAAEWTAANPVLDAREPGVEIDTASFKIGDGVTAWNSLPYSGKNVATLTSDIQTAWSAADTAKLTEAKAYTDQKAFQRPNLTSTDNWNDITTNGRYLSTLNPANWADLNMPMAGRFTLEVGDILPGAKIQEATVWTTVAGSARKFYRGYSSAGWGPWVQTAGPDIATTASVTAVATRATTLEGRATTLESRPPGSGLKTVGVPLCAGHSGSDGALAGTYRIPMDWIPAAVPVTRAKVRIRNMHIRAGTTRAGTVTLDGVWLGVPDSAGHFATAPLQMAGPTTFDGAVGYETPWVVVPGGTLTDKAVSYSYSIPSAPWAMLATGWHDPDRVGGNIGFTGMATANVCAFTVDIIVETHASTHVLAAFGDSNSVGVGAKYMQEAWVTKLAGKIGAIPQLLGSSGDTLVGSRTTTAFKWNRFPGHARADTVLWALGQNDVGAAYSTAQIITDLDTLVPKAKELLGRSVYVVSLMPRNPDTHVTFEADRQTVNTALKTQSRGDRGYIDIIPAVSDDDDTFKAGYSTDGTHLTATATEAVAQHVHATHPVLAPSPQPSHEGFYERTMRLSDMRDRLGPVDVHAKGAIAIVMDHGLNNFRDIVLPLLQARNIPVTLSVNSDYQNTVGDTDNNLVTPTELKTWHDSGLVEIANHGRTHREYESAPDNTREIEAGRKEIEAWIEAPVDSWVQIGGTSYTGFDNGDAAEKYWSTHIGREIIRTHSVITGLVPSDRLYPLDGNPTIGMQGGWIDGDPTSVNGAITSAVTNRQGYMVRFHPQVLNTGTNTTTQELTDWLDYLVGRRDAGEIEILQLRKLAVARKVLSPTGPGSDTGWRKLTNEAGLDAGNIFLRRMNNTVHMMVQGVSTVADGHTNIAAIPVGFRPDGLSASPWRNGLVASDDGSAVRMASYYSGYMRILSAVATSIYGGYFTWPTPDTFPATLPGSAT